MPKTKFKQNIKYALKQEELQKSLGGFRHGLMAKRQNILGELPDFEQHREYAKNAKDQVLSEWEKYLNQFCENFEKQGGKIYFAIDGTSAQDIIVDLCNEVEAKLVAKSKSMTSEEIHLNKALENAQMKVVETDLGEYIIQLRNETPSHIIMPAIHLSKNEIEESFKKAHKNEDPMRNFSNAELLVREARKQLRHTFLNADVGITGANFLVADEGIIAIVTNEGNADLTLSLPKRHIIITSVEKLVANITDCFSFIRLLPRSATGQSITSYVSFIRAAQNKDIHLVLLDNGRSQMANNVQKQMLRCIRCGACMNHCPVYQTIGGHAYENTYPGPMGSVLSANILGISEKAELSFASTGCKRCDEVCPVKIPLTSLMHDIRTQAYEQNNVSLAKKYILKIWAYMMISPKKLKYANRVTLAIMRIFSRIQSQNNRLTNIPLLKAWFSSRDLPINKQKSFLEQWRDNRDA
ncbi:MAG: lactate utilization protein B [Niabella sp.]